MADMYGALRSDWFRVKNVEKFKEWFKGYHFGEFIELWEEGDTVAFGGDEQYPSAYPRVNNSDEVDSEQEGDAPDLYPEADLENFAKELREHFADENQKLYVVAGGAEKLRYVAFSVLHIDSKVAQFRSFSSDSPELPGDAS